METELSHFRQGNEKGDAQRAIQKRDKAFSLLEDWTTDFLEVAKIALEEDFQLLEKMGIVV